MANFLLDFVIKILAASVLYRASSLLSFFFFRAARARGSGCDPFDIYIPTHSATRAFFIVVGFLQKCSSLSFYGLIFMWGNRAFVKKICTIIGTLLLS